MQKLRNIICERSRDESGFTLVELLMVMVIIGVLAGLGFTGFNALQNRAAVAKADTYWRDLNTAIGMFKVEVGGFPEIVKAESEDENGDVVKDLSAYLDVGSEPWKDADPLGESDSVSKEGVQYRIAAGADGESDTVCVWVDGQPSGNNVGCNGD